MNLIRGVVFALSLEAVVMLAIVYVVQVFGWT